MDSAERGMESPVKTRSEYNKDYRARRKAFGLCIWGCGRRSTKGSGLCDECAAKNNQKCISRHHEKRLSPLADADVRTMLSQLYPVA